MSEHYKRYRVWMHIRGSAGKPPYDGYVDVYAESMDDAFDRAVAKSRRTAHWDCQIEAFRLEKIEVRS